MSDEQFTFFWNGPFSQWYPSYFTVDGHRAANIQFDLIVPASELLTAEGAGSALLERVINQGIVMLCAEAVVLPCRRCL